MDQKYIVGKKGEEIATQFLQKKGYKILERNFYTKQGEIDIIAKDKKEYVFVEVKTRTNKKYGEPIDAIDKRKIKHIKRAIRYYLYLNHLEKQTIRIDAIEIYYHMNTIQIHHIKQAIE